MRFDEVELEPGTFDAGAESPGPSGPAVFFKRLAALLIDLSLFAALGLALSPLLPSSMSAISIASLVGFVLIVAFYYFAGTLALWGKTIGGAIFDVPVIARRHSVSR